jgi:predicted ATPase
VTRFFGREAEIDQLKTRLKEHRLMTLVGSGGVGKTRLSLQAAEELVDDFSDGVWLVLLAPLSDATLVTQTVVASLGLRDEPGRPALDSLIDYLHPRQALLVLDNCEHVLEACAHLAEQLLRNCPRVKVLASSREPLGIVGEAMLAVPSLPFPVAGPAPEAEQLASYASVGLFIDRARLVLPDYDITPHNAAAIAHLCQRLDGIPLAIEMAAARVGTLSAGQLADRLDDAFRLLTGGSRTALPRQQTLRATLDWSYHLLNDAQRRLLARLSVFAGGCTLEAAEAVCGDASPGEGLEAGEVLEVLIGLAAKSMVITDRRQGEAARYRLLEVVRQYAREKLNEAGEGARLHTRHRDCFLSLAESEAAQRETQVIMPPWNSKLAAAERDNLRQALEWSFSDLSEVEAGPRLLGAIGYDPGVSRQEILDRFLRGVAWCQSRTDISARLHVNLLRAAAMHSARNDPQKAVDLATRAVDISRGMGAGGKELLMRSLSGLAHYLFADADAPDQAVAPLAEAEAILQTLEPGYFAPEEEIRTKAHFALQRAQLAQFQGRYLDEKKHAAEIIRLSETSGVVWFAADGHTTMGIACLRLREYPEAREHLLVALDLNREYISWAVANNLRLLAAVDLGEGNLERAMDYCRESITEAELTPDRNLTASNLGLLAAICARQGQATRAARLAGAAAAMWARQKRKPWEDSSLDTILLGWRDGPGAATIQQAFEAGQGLRTDEAVALALGQEADEA